MKPASWRTTTAYHLRALSRQLLIAWYDLLDRLETWWKCHVFAADPYDGASDAEVLVGTWEGPNVERYPDGAAEVHVADLGRGSEPLMIALYLAEIRRPAPKGVLG